MTWRDDGEGSGMVLDVHPGDWLLMSLHRTHCDLVATATEPGELEAKARRQKLRRPFIVQAAGVWIVREHDVEAVRS